MNILCTVQRFVPLALTTKLCHMYDDSSSSPSKFYLLLWEKVRCRRDFAMSTYCCTLYGVQSDGFLRLHCDAARLEYGNVTV